MGGAMTEAEQFQALRTWLLAITGLPNIIRAHPNAPRPAKPYAMANLIRSERINWPSNLEYEDIEDPGEGAPAKQVTVETWEFVWSLHLYGDEGTGYAARITSASKSDAALLSLHPLTLHRTSGIRRIPELLNETLWEDRAQLDLFVRGIVRHGFDTDLVEAVTVEFPDGDSSASIIVPPPPAPEDPISEDPEP
jgi:hypothetical protein